MLVFAKGARFKNIRRYRQYAGRQPPPQKRCHLPLLAACRLVPALVLVRLICLA